MNNFDPILIVSPHVECQGTMFGEYPFCKDRAYECFSGCLGVIQYHSGLRVVIHLRRWDVVVVNLLFSVAVTILLTQAMRPFGRQHLL